MVSSKSTDFASVSRNVLNIMSPSEVHVIAGIGSDAAVGFLLLNSAAERSTDTQMKVR